VRGYESGQNAAAHLKSVRRRSDGPSMSTDHEMPSAWRAQAARNGWPEDAAVPAAGGARARDMREAAFETPLAGGPEPGAAGAGAAGAGAADAGAPALDELSRRRIARFAAEEARRLTRPTDPPGPPLPPAAC
jgi:hypothetical protein